MIWVSCRMACAVATNDPSSATRRTGRDDYNHDALAGFAGAHGKAIVCSCLFDAENLQGSCDTLCARLTSLSCTQKLSVLCPQRRIRLQQRLNGTPSLKPRLSLLDN